MGRRRDRQWVYNYLDPENGQNLVVRRWTSDGSEEEETKIFAKIANHKLMGDLHYWGKVQKSYFILIKVESPCVSRERVPVMDNKVLVESREKARDEIEREHKVDVYVQAVIDRLRIAEKLLYAERRLKKRTMCIVWSRWLRERFASLRFTFDRRTWQKVERNVSL
jgi:hypothetical protein